MKRQSEQTISESNWLNTYADTITLLLTFFILLYSISNVDAEKWQKVVNAFNKNIEVSEVVPEGPMTVPEELIDIDNEFDNLYKKLKEYIEENNLTASIEIHKGDDYNFIVFKNNVFFNGDSSYLRPDGEKILDYLCEGISQVTSSIGEMRILGHTSQARADKPNNQVVDRTLSTERANSVLLYIQSKNIIDPAKLVSVGYGQHRPLNDNSTEKLRMENRRVEILIAKNSESDKLLNEIYDSISKKQ